MPERTYWVLSPKEDYDDSRGKKNKQRKQVGEKEGYLVASLCTNGKHAPVIDLDFPVYVIKNMDTGVVWLHFSKKVRRHKFQKLLDTLAECGIIDDIKREATGFSWRNYFRNSKLEPDIILKVPFNLVPSSTPGHCHLYLDTELTWPFYKKLLTCLCQTGLIERGYYRTSITHRKSFLLKQGVTKATVRRLQQQGKMPSLSFDSD